MKVAVVGSRSIKWVDLEKYVSHADEIVSGGAIGVDSCAAEYAARTGKKLTEFLPDYATYGRSAPIVRNRLIVEYVDEIYAFWDGSSRGTRYVVDYAAKVGKPCRLFKQKNSAQR